MPEAGRRPCLRISHPSLRFASHAMEQPTPTSDPLCGTVCNRIELYYFTLLLLYLTPVIDSEGRDVHHLVKAT